METNIERRVYDAEFRVAEDGDGKPKLDGYAAVFDRDSENLGGFVERIEQGAFSDVLGDDVRALFNHDSNWLLGRTAAATLTISEDKTGLHSEIWPPDTSAGRDTVTSIKRGDVTAMSFAFSIAPDGDRWEDFDDGRTVRTITKVGRLYDVSPVTFPAYPDTTIAARSLEMHRETTRPHGRSADVLRRELEIVESED